MKRILCWILLFALGACAACAETARDYALWLEEVLPDAEFADAEVPGFVTGYLGADYNFIARSDPAYGCYIAGVRREDAPALPEGAHQTAYEGTFESRIFQAADAEGNVLYEFVLTRDVYMRAYDGLEHLLVWIDPNGGGAFSSPDTPIFSAADAHRRAQLVYAREMGFSQPNENRMQMLLEVHNLHSWQEGATKEPTAFCLNMTIPENLLEKEYLEESELIRHVRIPIGIRLQDGEMKYDLVMSENGIPAVESCEPHRLYAAGEGYDAVLNLAEKMLGYRPGKIDFIGKESVRAELLWQGGSIVLEDAKKLDQLDALLKGADFSVGSVNCPSPCFLKMEFADGSSAELAVAVNSFDLFFCNGLYFATENDIIDLFELRETDFYRQYMGG